MFTIIDFLRAAQDGDFEKLKLIMQEGMDVNSKGTLINKNGYVVKGGTALHHAAQHLQLEIVKYLIEHGANVNAATEEGDWLPLHAVAHFCLKKNRPILVKEQFETAREICKVLLDNGGNILAKAGLLFKLIPVDCAIAAGNRGIVAILEEASRKADSAIKIRETSTKECISFYAEHFSECNPLSVAIAYNDLFAIESMRKEIKDLDFNNPRSALLKYFANRLPKYLDGFRGAWISEYYDDIPLQEAVRCNQPRIVKYFLDLGSKADFTKLIRIIESELEFTHEDEDFKACATETLNILKAAETTKQNQELLEQPNKISPPTF